MRSMGPYNVHFGGMYRILDAQECFHSDKTKPSKGNAYFQDLVQIREDDNFEKSLVCLGRISHLTHGKLLHGKREEQGNHAVLYGVSFPV